MVLFFMALCYLANPMHAMLSEVFHDLSHFMEQPAALVHHHSHGSESKYHHHQEHEHPSVSHHHQLIDFFDSLFQEHSEQKKQDQNFQSLISLDKHINSTNIKLTPIHNFEKKANFIKISLPLVEGHYSIILHPPNLISF